MSLTLAITTFNRLEMLLESFQLVENNERISEIVIVDDCSPGDIFLKLREAVRDKYKIKLYQQAVNRGMSRNKADAVSYATNEWVILLDSDNILSDKYIEAIPLKLNRDVIYCPDFAMPDFDYRRYSGHEINRINVGMYATDALFNMALNTCNYVVHRDEYLKIYKENDMMKATDTKWFAFLWLKSGHSFQVMRNCSYFHRVHKGSGFMADVKYNMKMDKALTRLIQNL